MLEWGRELFRDRAAAEAREWLCTNGLRGFASGTASSVLTRRYHGLLVAALAPPLGRTLLVEACAGSTRAPRASTTKGRAPSNAVTRTPCGTGSTRICQPPPRVVPW